MGLRFSSSDPELLTSFSGNAIRFWNCRLSGFFPEGLGPSKLVSQSLENRLGYVEFCSDRQQLEGLHGAQGLPIPPHSVNGSIQFHANPAPTEWEVACTFICETIQFKQLESSAISLLTSVNTLALTFDFNLVGFPTTMSQPGVPNAADFENGVPVWVHEFTQTLHRRA